MQKSTLIKRTYRITKDHDKLVKKTAKKKSESEVVRNLIDTLKVEV
jgi:hypothetical protein